MEECDRDDFTLVYQIEDGMKRLLWVAQDRTEDKCCRTVLLARALSAN